MNLRQAAQQALQAMQFAGNAHEFAAVAADLEAALAEPEQEPVNKYCCHACFNKSGQFFLDRMILCPKCGNKRCPKASHHDLPCTNSNEPGQEGSIYTAPTPRKPQTTHWEGCEAVHPECRKPDTDCHEQGICQRSGYSIAPTPRKPLTDEEIADLWDGHTVPVFGKTGINPIVFARAIERAHGIGEQHE